MHNYKELIAWQKARVLVKEVYSVTQNFPNEERFGITNQIRRASVSITNNIAEGCGRGTTLDMLRFFDYAYASSFEVENMLLLSLDLEFISDSVFEQLEEQIKEVQRLIFGFQKMIKQKK